MAGKLPIAIFIGAMFLTVSSAFILDLFRGADPEPTGRPEFCRDHQCPNFTMIARTPDYEIRRYEPTTWVSTRRENGWFQTVKMFQRLAKYTLRGYNSEGLRMEMTVPVLKKISDTEPEVMYFMLPDAQQSNPPTPTDPKVTIVRMPAQDIYVRSFGGFATDGKWTEELEALKTALGPDVRYVTGVMFKVSYNKPWTILNRHNEVWLIKA